MSVHARHAWDGPAAWPAGDVNSRNKGVWLPKPIKGRYMTGRRPRDTNPQLQGPGVEGVVEALTGAAVHLMIVPGPQGLYQVVRVHFETPVARGFRTKEQARGWIGRAVRAGILPEGVVEVEPPGSDQGDEP